MKTELISLIVLTALIVNVFTQMNPNILKGKKIKYRPQKNEMRKISETNNYEEIRIFLDFTYIKHQSQENTNLSEIEKLIENSLESSINNIKKLINVIPLSYPINKISTDDLLEWGFKSNKFINKSLLPNEKGIKTDLIILTKFIESGEENLLIDNQIASISNKFILDEITKRPIVGVIYINPNIDINLGNIDIYLKSIFLHELTHILGFHYDLFKYFPGGIEKTIKTDKEKRTKIEKKFITTPKVVEFAKKYFNCPEIEGVELENQPDLTMAHWEARILLGEYMTSSPYTPDQVISEFTLSLLEDSGWYKPNYYTGGLMRFGKNKGCDFLTKDCISSDGKLNSNFKNEFCDFSMGDQPTCSLGRQSRSYCITYSNLQVEEKFRNYRRFRNWFGKENADFCPVSDIEVQEEKDIYYVGNCNYGNGKYGTHNNFGNLSFSNKNFEEILGEKYGPNSFCVLSTILPEEKTNIFGSQTNSHHAVCYPMNCSSKSLTIQIYDQYIVCPREGGKVELSGKYKGYLLCPDYNSICAGTTLCNDMLDCIEKKSLIKEESFNYDYEINLDEEKIYKAEDIAELGEDGLCPKNCGQCGEGKKCLKCLDGYTFAKDSKYDLSIKCIKSDEIDEEKYCYKDNGIYYNCEWKIENLKIKEEISKENIDNIIEDYIEDKNYTEKKILFYKSDNQSIIIYKGEGNKELLDSISSDNEKEIIKLLNENEKNKNEIKVIIKSDDEYYISLYDENGNELNVKEECPDCSNIIITIKNNYENALNNKFGKAIKSVIVDNKINIFDDESPIFNDICSNFTVSGIDIPVNSRKDIFYLGENKNEIICGNANCQIIKEGTNKKNELEGECKCDINLNLDNINTNDETKDTKKEKSYKTTMSGSEKFKNSFSIFKCFKNGKFIKANEGFYITICSLGVQAVCFSLYLIFTPKLSLLSAISVANPIGKKNGAQKDSKINNSYKSEESGDIMNEKEEKSKPSYNNVKIENNIMNYGNIDEDIIEDDKLSNNKGIENTNFHYRDVNEIRLDTIKIENKANFKLNRNLSMKSMSEDTKSLDEKDDLNKNIFSKKQDDNLITDSNNVNTNNQLYVTTGNGENKPKETVEVEVEHYSLHGSVNKKLNFKEKDDKEEFGEKLKKNNKKVLILFGNKSKSKKSKSKNKEFYENYKNSEKEQDHDQELPLDYLSIDKAIQLDKRSFCTTYWNILSFKQPIINIFSFLDVLRITRSCIPMQMKIIRFLLMLILNLFINSMTITQNYFKEKYKYFNKKYQIEESDTVKIKIDPVERLSYAMKHCFPEVIITFIICVIVQFIVNFIFFGIRRELCLISINEKKENINKEVQKLIKKTKTRYIIFAFINLVFMIIFFVYLTNFTTAYSGGALDYIGAGIWTFIFLQIFPFISSLVATLLRHNGMKNNKEGMYKMSQVLLA